MTQKGKSGAQADVEIYSTRFLPQMLYPRTQERGGKQEPVIHRCTGTAQPPVCFVAFSEYQKLERAKALGDAEIERLGSLLKAEGTA